MKYGQQFESESVPEWSLHNIDYNTLKEFIKAHTTRDQATAITIPGQQDTALFRFENDFYDELCRQHDRVGLFVATKADEINRRLQHLSDQIHRLTLMSTTSVRGTASLKRQRRYAKYGRAASQLGDEIRDLTRFANAQVVAFRKILKKYRKWTGSGSLGSRFRENVLSDPKSFTRRDFSHLETQCDELVSILRSATPVYGTPGVDSPPGSPSGRRFCRRSSSGGGGGGHVHSSSSSTLQALSSSAGSGVTQIRTMPDVPPRTTILAPTPTPAEAPAPTHYWNEYDDGSEAGDASGPGNGGYAIYMQPDDDDIPGMAMLVSFFTVPIEKARRWIEARGIKVPQHQNGEHAPLIIHQHTNYGTHTGVAGSSSTDDGEDGLFSSGEASSAGEQRQRARRVSKAPAERNGDEAEAEAEDEQDVDDEDDSDNEHPRSDLFASDSEFPYGYEAHYASLPSINDQRIARFRETMLLRGALGCYAAALVLLGVAAILINTGRHRLRVEVDAGVIMGVVTSLGFACAALGMIMAKHDRLGLLAGLAIWAVFGAICVLNGVVLVFVMGNTVVVGAGGRA